MGAYSRYLKEKVTGDQIYVLVTGHFSLGINLVEDDAPDDLPYHLRFYGATDYRC